MSQTIIRAMVIDQAMRLVEKPLVASGGVKETKVAFEFCEKWDGFAKTGVFYRDEEEPYHVLLDEDDTCVIPWEVCAEPGDFFFTVFGNKDGIRRTTNTIRYRVSKGFNSDAMTPTDPTPSVYEQIMEKLEGAGSDDTIPDSGQNGNGLSTTAAALLITILRNAVYNGNQSANITALETTLASGGSSGGDTPDNPVEPDEPVNPDVTLTSISATYSGGNVAAGTAVTALTGIVVTAHYSDGSTATVTGYTLSGTIAEGSNTVTVSYGGKTTTFTVTGVAGEESSSWVSGWINGEGTFTPDDEYMGCEEYFPVTPGQNYYLSNENRAWKGTNAYWAYYDADKNYILRTTSATNADLFVNGWVMRTADVAPDGAAFVRVSCNNMDGFTDTAIIATELPDVGTTFEETTWSEGYVSSNSNIQQEEGCWVSWYVNVEAGATYKFGNSVEGWSSSWYGIGIYSDAITQITRVATPQFTVPNGAKYVRLSAQNMTGYCETATLTKVS